jgi:hypothetical protein
MSELSDVFKQAVIEKSDLHMRRPKKDITFTFSRVAEILGIGSIKNRARQFKQIMKHANIFEWSDEMIQPNPQKEGNKSLVKFGSRPLVLSNAFTSSHVINSP